MARSPPVTPSLSSRLEAFLARAIDGLTTLQHVERLSGGASQETYRLDVMLGQQPHRFALRRSSLPSRPGLETEAQLIRAAHAAGVAVPQVVAVLPPEAELGTGFVMEWLDGETLGKRINTSNALAKARAQLAFQAGRTLAKIHAIDLDASGLRGCLTTWSPADLVQDTWARYQAFGSPQPMLDYSARWLLDHLPEAPELGLVHGDFRNGNLMVRADGLAAVLDWELAHIGDPMRDLGWLCTASWRFGQTHLPVGGFGTKEQLFAGYASVSGQAVDPTAVRFWEVFGSFWWAVTCLAMADSFRSGEDRSLERAAIGRRTSEGQIDCVNLLLNEPAAQIDAAERENAPVEAAGEPAEGQPMQAPTAADTEKEALGDLPQIDELLQGVEAFLRADAIAGLTGRSKFLARVAANAVAIVSRDARTGPAAREAEHARLRALLGHEGPLLQLRQDFAAALRAGRFSLTTPAVVDHLRRTVAAQVAIDQPGYAGLTTFAGHHHVGAATTGEETAERGQRSSKN